jgi:hypothetical protein
MTLLFSVTACIVVFYVLEHYVPFLLILNSVCNFPYLSSSTSCRAVSLFLNHRAPDSADGHGVVLRTVVQAIDTPLNFSEGRANARDLAGRLKHLGLSDFEDLDIVKNLHTYVSFSEQAESNFHAMLSTRERANERLVASNPTNQDDAHSLTELQLSTRR